LLAAIGVMLNVYLALLVLAHGGALLASWRRTERPRWLFVAWGISACTAAGIASPIVRLVLAQSGQLPFGPLSPGGVANTLFFGQYFVGATPTIGRGVPVPPTTLWATSAILLACCGWALLIAPIVRRRLRPPISTGNQIGLFAVALPWIVVPFVSIIGISLIVTPVYTGRYFSFTTPGVALLMGSSLAAIASQWKRVLAIVVLALLALPVFLSQRAPTAKNDTDWQQAAAIIQSHATPGQDIYYGPVKTGSALSISKIRDAYPAVLSRLNDITLKQGAAEKGTLWDSEWPLAHAQPELRRTPLLWVVLEHYGSPSPSSTKQEKYIERNGLHRERDWRGPSTDVLLFVR
jgi:mannosyltransferase